METKVMVLLCTSGSDSFILLKISLLLLLMDEQPYKLTEIDQLAYEFTSKGRKFLQKQVRFTQLKADPDVYNLALGTVQGNGYVDFRDASNNGDVVKVFITVVACIKQFTDSNPGKIVFFKGNTEQKTKIYNEILRRHYAEFSEEFSIFGKSIFDDVIFEFDVNSDYSGFFVTRK